MISNFKCRRCGNCCTIDGSVDIKTHEIDAIAAHLGLEPRQFAERYAELKPNRQGLKLKDHADGSCIFLGRDRLCRIEPVKPSQCRGFPLEWRYPEWVKVCSSNYPSSSEKEISPNEA